MHMIHVKVCLVTQHACWYVKYCISMQPEGQDEETGFPFLAADLLFMHVTFKTLPPAPFGTESSISRTGSRAIMAQIQSSPHVSRRHFHIYKGAPQVSTASAVQLATLCQRVPQTSEALQEELSSPQL